jgi:hypothetical protein
LALDRIVSAIQHANYLEIDAPNSTLTLSRKVGEEYISSRYYRDPGGNLCYQPDLSASPLPSPEIVLPSVTGFQLTGFPEGGERFQMARVRLEAEDPQGIARRDALFQTAAFCRIFHGSYKPVRVVTRDSSGNVTTVKGSYDTIQAAIDAETTEHGDVVQVSSNDKIPYDGAKITKALTLEGGYDSVDWNRHYENPDNPGQIDPAYETIVRASYVPDPRKNDSFAFYDPGGYWPSTKSCVIDGFSLQGGGGIPQGISIANEHYETLSVTDNKFSNMDKSILLSSVGDPGGNSKTIIEGNIIQRIDNKFLPNNASLIGISFSGAYGQFEIKKNIIENVAVRCFGIDVIKGSCGQTSNISIHNNTIRNFHLTLQVDKSVYSFQTYGIRMFDFTGVNELAEVTIANNEINSLNIINPDYFAKKKVKPTLAAFMGFQGDYALVISNNLVRNISPQLSIGASSLSSIILMQNNEFASSTGTVHSVSVGGDAPARVYNNIFNSVTLWLGQHNAWGTDIKNNTFYPGRVYKGIQQRNFWSTATIRNNYFRCNPDDRNDVGFYGTNNKTTMSNNIFYGCQTGIEMNGGCGPLIYNNTMYNTYTCMSLYGITHGATVTNNIMQGYTSKPIYISSGPSFDYMSNWVAYNASQTDLQATLMWQAYCGVNYNFSSMRFAGSGDLPNDFKLASGSPCIDVGWASSRYSEPSLNYDPYDKVKYPTPDPPDTTPALLPARGTIRTDIGAYGGPHAGPIGFIMPTEDDPNTEYIREDVIGTY